MNIEEVAVLPYRQVLTFGARELVRERFWYRVRSACGHEGMGDAAPWAPRTVDPLVVGDELAASAQAVCVRLADEPAELREQIKEISSPYAPPSQAGIEIALIDILARRRGVGFASALAWLMEVSGPAPVVRTNQLVFGQDHARRAASPGAVLKVKLSDPNAVEDFLAWGPRVPGVTYRVDFNRAFSAASLLALWPRLCQVPIQYLEDPLPSADIAGWRTLSKAGIPLALDETHSETLYTDRVAAIRVLKPQFEGFLSVAERVKTYRAAGRQVTVTTALESTIGRAATIHLARTLAPDWVHGLGGLGKGDDWTLARAGEIAVPERVGVGVHAAH